MLPLSFVTMLVRPNGLASATMDATMMVFGLEIPENAVFMSITPVSTSSVQQIMPVTPNGRQCVSRAMIINASISSTHIVCVVIFLLLDTPLHATREKSEHGPL